MPGAKLKLRVQFQPCDSNTAYRRYALNQAHFAVVTKMVAPAVLARVKQGAYLPRIFVPSRCSSGLMRVARGTRQSQIVQAITAPGSPWLDMLNLKGKVKDMFRGAAVFAPPGSPCRHVRVERVHVFTGVSAFVRAMVASKAASISPSNSARSSTVNVS